MAIFPSAVSTNSDLYITVNQTTTQLTDNPLSDVATTVNVVDASAFPTVGFISIDSEIIKYTGKTATSFTGCTRGQDGTTAASHVQNSQVYHNVIAAHHNVLKDEIIAIEQNISDRMGLGSTQIKGQNGSQTSPTYSFAGNVSTGMFQPSANVIGFTSNGATVAYLDSSNGLYPTADNIYKLGSPSAKWSDLYINSSKASGGSAGSPSYTFDNDPDTGIYNSSANSLGISTAGSVKITVDSGGTTTFVESIREKDGSSAAPSFTFSNDTDTGIYSPSANTLGVTSGGTQSMSLALGTIRALGAAEQNLYITSSSGPELRILSSGGSSACYIQTQSNHPLVLTTNNGTDAVRIDTNKNVVIGSAALSTSATDGFLYIESCAGAPSGTPTSFTGRVPMVYDSTNNRIYVYSGGTWRSVTLA